MTVSHSVFVYKKKMKICLHSSCNTFNARSTSIHFLWTFEDNTLVIDY